MPDADQIRQLQAVERLWQVAQQKNRQPIRFAQIGSDLRQVAVGSQPDGTSQRRPYGAERLFDVDRMVVALPRARSLPINLHAISSTDITLVTGMQELTASTMRW